MKKGNKFYQRDKATEARLKMVKKSRPIRNKKGKIVKEAPFQSKLAPGTQARIQPNRKWFGNTKTISQDTLQKFREDITKAMSDPYQIIMTPSKLPTTLLHASSKFSRPQILQISKFQDVFGKKATRKKPNINFLDVEDFATSIRDKTESFENADSIDKEVNSMSSELNDLVSDTIFNKGQSKRIWNELYKVIDSSDVLIQVLDGRDPMGTRSQHIENFLRKHKPHKHLIFLLNKCDLIPPWCSKRWVSHLSKEYPTLAYKASINQCFGKGSLINVLRQFAKLHPERKQISVGFFGYPNVGKSSIINSLKAKKVCQVAPTPGHTKVWQYITLMNRIYLIDCPGVVYPENNSESDLILKGVVRVENVKDAHNHIQNLIDKMPNPSYLLNTYDLNLYYNNGVKPLLPIKQQGKIDHDQSLNDIKTIETKTDDVNLNENVIIEGDEEILRNKNVERIEAGKLLECLALRMGKLLKAGEPDICTAAKIILYDWQRGKIPYFTMPPKEVNETDKCDDNISNVETMA